MIEVRQEREPSFSAYAAVSAAFTVRSRLHVESLTGGPEGSSLAEVPVRPPSVKDYSAAAGSPARWPELFDVARRAGFVARDGDERVGGASWMRPTNRPR